MFAVLFQAGVAVIIYVAPDPIDDVSCTDSGHRFTPCYSLHQLNHTILSHKTETTLFFFSGKHVIFEHQTLSVSNTTQFVVAPYLWNKQKVVVECQLPAHLEFHDVQDLRVSGTTFMSCSLNLTRSLVTAFGRKLSITDCIFLYKGIDYTIVAPLVDITVANCVFQFNNGAINCNDHTFATYDKFRVRIKNSIFSKSIRESDYNSTLNIRHVHLRLDGCQFIENVGTMGGAIYSEFSIVQVESTIFECNSAQDSGGALYCLYTVLEVIHTQFHSNFANMSGGALYFTGIDSDTENNAEEDFSLSDTNFTYNHAGLAGGALYCKSDIIEEVGLGRIGTSYSKLNSAINGGFAYLSRCQITKYGFEISNNNAINGGAFYAQESAIVFSGIINNISYNVAIDKGGALFLQKSQIKLLYDGPRILFDHNVVTSVNGKGGAIYVLDNSCEVAAYSDYQCFVYDYGYVKNSTLLTFTDNRATQGSVLYGGLLDRCLPPPKYRHSSHFNVIEEFKRISDYEQGALVISSEPIGVCVCISSFVVDCNLNELNLTRMRGESMKLKIAAIDQDGNTVPSIVTAFYKEALSAELKQGERSTDIVDTCTEVKYHIFTLLPMATLVLEPSENPRPLSNITINIFIVPCSHGFERDGNTCICDRRLTNHFNITVCDIDTRSVQRVGSVWLRYDEKYLKVHANCPLDYCQVSENLISLSSSNNQCANRRSGVLCGACLGNLSIALGGSKCLHCTSIFTAIGLITVFALAGVMLVALLLVCNITVSTGTLNGLIFYVNVVSTSGITNLYIGSLHPILLMFIAWLNLDLGVETCFYPGMDTYQKTWLQFVFPVYIWLLVVVIIVASYYSTTAMKLFGRNNIAILATLFLLSYSKLLKTIVTSLSFSQVWKGTADNVSDQLVPYKVWSYDGNVKYLKEQHTALFIVGLLFFLFPFLPYTAMLIFGQCIRSMSVKRMRGLGWIHSIAFISILDAYHAPYRRPHRYWTGLMLLTRCILFLVFATNSTDNPLPTNMFAVTLAVMGILIIKSHITKVYRQAYIETLELCFLLNLGVLSATLYYLVDNLKDNNERIVYNTVTASISLSFAMFIGIVAYHIHLQARKTKYYASILESMWQRYTQTVPSHPKVVDSVETRHKPPITTTTIELSQRLLESPDELM